VLDELRERGWPVSLVVDPATALVCELLIPEAFHVAFIAPAPVGDELEVEFDPSHARHHLRVSSPDFPRLVGVLTQAYNSGEAVLVTESLSGCEILDARVIGGPARLALQSTAAGGEAISLGRAQQLFQIASGPACAAHPAAAIAPPCVPFLYPEDGCWARAHEMSRLLLAAMAASETALLRKTWIYGRLSVRTNHTPACRVSWGWHVAPSVPVDSGARSPVAHIIDPSLFGDVVPLAEWQAAQGDPSSQIVQSDPSVFQRRRDGRVTYDADYSQTARVLAVYRLKLKNRVVSLGPPPYQC
jgi:hypothetical protein